MGHGEFITVSFFVIHTYHFNHYVLLFSTLIIILKNLQIIVISYLIKLSDEINIAFATARAGDLPFFIIKSIRFQFSGLSRSNVVYREALGVKVGRL